MRSNKLTFLLLVFFLLSFFVVDMPVKSLWKDNTPVLTAGPNCDDGSGSNPGSGSGKDRVGAPEPSLFYLLGVGAAALVGYSIYKRKKKE